MNDVARVTHGVHKGAPTLWRVGGRSLRVRVVRPDAAGPLPLVLFSHGFALDIDQYDAVLDHWASHGYCTIAPYHRDGGGTARGIFNSLRYGSAGLISERVADLKLILDHLDALDGIEPGLAARIDTTRIAAAGHSFGAFSAPQLGGAASVDPKTGARIEGRDPRVRCIVGLSPPGEMFGLINARSWENLDVPMLATTGTNDMDGRFIKDWRAHTLCFQNAKPGANWLLVLDGADHYLGNLIGRPQRKAAPQHEALRAINALSVTFLDAFVRNDAAARAALESPNLVPNATRFEHR